MPRSAWKRSGSRGGCGVGSGRPALPPRPSGSPRLRRGLALGPVGGGIGVAGVEPRAPAAIDLDEEIGGAESARVLHQRPDSLGVLEHALAAFAQDP